MASRWSSTALLPRDPDACTEYPLLGESSLNVATGAFSGVLGRGGPGESCDDMLQRAVVFKKDEKRRTSWLFITFWSLVFHVTTVL